LRFAGAVVRRGKLIFWLPWRIICKKLNTEITAFFAKDTEFFGYFYTHDPPD
jgi:hypothetical protein